MGVGWGFGARGGGRGRGGGGGGGRYGAFVRTFPAWRRFSIVMFWERVSGFRDERGRGLGKQNVKEELTCLNR